MIHSPDFTSATSLLRRKLRNDVYQGKLATGGITTAGSMKQPITVAFASITLGISQTHGIER